MAEPNDVDCVLLIGDDYPNEMEADEQLQAGLPFLQLLFVQRAALQAEGESK